MNCKCPHCGGQIELSLVASWMGKAGGHIGGASRSERKRAASRANGMKRKKAPVPAVVAPVDASGQ